jgi:hypothetical protein
LRVLDLSTQSTDLALLITDLLFETLIASFLGLVLFDFNLVVFLQPFVLYLVLGCLAFVGIDLHILFA